MWKKDGSTVSIILYMKFKNSRRKISFAGGISMKTMNEEVFSKENVFGKGQSNTAYAQYFIGESFLKPLTSAGSPAVGLANVTFEPGCRNNWHIHHADKGGGQIL